MACGYELADLRFTALEICQSGDSRRAVCWVLGSLHDGLYLSFSPVLSQVLRISKHSRGSMPAEFMKAETLEPLQLRSPPATRALVLRSTLQCTQTFAPKRPKGTPPHDLRTPPQENRIFRLCEQKNLPWCCRLPTASTRGYISA